MTGRFRFVADSPPICFHHQRISEKVMDSLSFALSGSSSKNQFDSIHVRLRGGTGRDDGLSVQLDCLPHGWLKQLKPAPGESKPKHQSKLFKRRNSVSSCIVFEFTSSPSPPSRNRTAGLCPSHQPSILSNRRSARPRRPAGKDAEISSQLAWSVPLHTHPWLCPEKLSTAERGSFGLPAEIALRNRLE